MNGVSHMAIPHLSKLLHVVDSVEHVCLQNTCNSNHLHIRHLKSLKKYINIFLNVVYRPTNTICIDGVIVT